MTLEGKGEYSRKLPVGAGDISSKGISVPETRGVSTLNTLSTGLKYIVESERA